MKPIPFSATVTSQEYSAKETRKTIFKIIDNSEIPHFSFSTGQFVNILVPNTENKQIMRAYSVASSSSCLPYFELCVKVVENGQGSGYIDSLKKGDTVNFMGPFGHFGQKHPEKPLVMVATGTGIAPMKAIVDELREKDFPIDTTLVYGVREEEYASYRTYFEDLSKEYSHFHFHFYVSRPDTTFVGKKGRVTVFFDEESTLEYLDTEFVLCGNPAMVKEVRNFLKGEKGVEKDYICVEAY